MKRIDLPFTVLDQEELETRFCDSDKISCFRKSQFMRD